MHLNLPRNIRAVWIHGCSNLCSSLPFVSFSPIALEKVEQNDNNTYSHLVLEKFVQVCIYQSVYQNQLVQMQWFFSGRYKYINNFLREVEHDFVNYHYAEVWVVCWDEWRRKITHETLDLITHDIMQNQIQSFFTIHF